MTGSEILNIIVIVKNSNMNIFGTRYMLYNEYLRYGEFKPCIILDILNTIDVLVYLLPSMTDLPFM